SSDCATYVICSMLRCCSLFFFSSRRRHTRSTRDWSSDVCSSDLREGGELRGRPAGVRAGARAGRRARATAADRARPLRSRPAPAPARPLSDAEDHLARAVVLFADMGMRAWLETSQPELQALGHLV